MRVVFDRSRNAPLDLDPYGASPGDLMAFLMAVTNHGTKVVSLFVGPRDADHFLPWFDKASVGVGLALYVWEALCRLHVDAFYLGFTWDWDEKIGLFSFFPAEV